MTAGVGDPLPAGGAADVKSNDIIEISDPNIFVIFLNFVDGKRRVTFSRWAGRKT